MALFRQKRCKNDVKIKKRGYIEEVNMITAD